MTGAHAASASWLKTPEPEATEPWAWPVDITRYDRTSTLTPAEQRELVVLAARHGRQGHWLARTVRELARLRTRSSRSFWRLAPTSPAAMER